METGRRSTTNWIIALINSNSLGSGHIVWSENRIGIACSFCHPSMRRINAVTAVLLNLAAVLSVKKGKVKQHEQFMKSAIACSAGVFSAVCTVSHDIRFDEIWRGRRIEVRVLYHTNFSYRIVDSRHTICVDYLCERE